MTISAAFPYSLEFIEDLNSKIELYRRNKSYLEKSLKDAINSIEKSINNPENAESPFLESLQQRLENLKKDLAEIEKDG